MSETFFDRAERMLGAAVMDALSRTRVAVFGLGGVGSWCAESLVRSGVGHLMLVDSDTVCASNVNRQAMATSRTLGRGKAETLAERLREINPEVELDVRRCRYCAESAAEFDLAAFDYVVDAIDSVEDKALLIRRALASQGTTLFSSMGAAFRMDPFRLRHTAFRKVEGDGLARALRHRFKREGGVPKRQFECVWSDERRASQKFERPCGSVVHTTASFGFALAGLVVADAEGRAADMRTGNLV